MIDWNPESEDLETKPDEPFMCPPEVSLIYCNDKCHFTNKIKIKGTIEADKTETMIVKYLPGIPRKFTKKLKIQISHFAPEQITITGEASFADIMLDLPRLDDDNYKNLRKVIY
jgi:hypothetical protein